MPDADKPKEWETPLLPALETPETMIIRRIMVGVRDEIKDIVRGEMDAVRIETKERYDRIEAAQTTGVAQREQIIRDVASLTTNVALNTQATEQLDKSVVANGKTCIDTATQHDKRIVASEKAISKITGIYLGAAGALGALSGVLAGKLVKWLG